MPYRPQERSSRPRSTRLPTIAFARLGVCSASSNAIIGPSPRTSPISVCSRRGRRAAHGSLADAVAAPGTRDRGSPRGRRSPRRTTGGSRRRSRRGRPAGTASISSARPVTRGERQAAADGLARDQQVGLDAVVLDRPHLPGARGPRLHLVVDVEDPVLGAELEEPRREVLAASGRSLPRPARARAPRTRPSAGRPRT